MRVLITTMPAPTPLIPAAVHALSADGKPEAGTEALGVDPADGDTRGRIRNVVLATVPASPTAARECGAPHARVLGGQDRVGRLRRRLLSQPPDADSPVAADLIGDLMRPTAPLLGDPNVRHGAGLGAGLTVDGARGAGRSVDGERTAMDGPRTLILSMREGLL